ncbi:MAG: hypothetical protein ACRC5C_01830, partial [Bacilli bacterium]
STLITTKYLANFQSTTATTLQKIKDLKRLFLANFSEEEIKSKKPEEWDRFTELRQSYIERFKDYYRNM